MARYKPSLICTLTAMYGILGFLPLNAMESEVRILTAFHEDPDTTDL